MKKQFLSFMAIAAAVFFGTTVFLPGDAQAAEEDFVIERDGTYSCLVGYNGPGGDVVIPASVDFINLGAFSGCTGLTSVTIPGSVSLGQDVFLNCTGLASVTLGEGMTEIPDHVFNGCTALTNVSIPSSISFIDINAFHDTPWLKSLGDFAVVNGILIVYQGNESDITIPDHVRSISPGAFRDCPGLGKVTLPNGFTSIESRVFLGSHIKEAVIPEGVAVIEAVAFSGCTDLAGVTLPNSLTAIGNGAFSGCSSLAEVVIPGGVTSIGPFAFEQCANLKKLVIPASVTSIGNDLLWKSTNAVIYGKAGSYAETYARENGIPFVIE